jgi:hypothetical protein
MKTIYRLEVKNKFRRKVGEGPYINDFHSNEAYRFRIKILDAHNLGDSHPSLKEDFDNQNINSNYYFGCKTLKDLKQWFRGHITQAKRSGFAIAEYKVMNYTLSNSGKQLIFNRHNVISKKYI